MGSSFLIDLRRLAVDWDGLTKKDWEQLSENHGSSFKRYRFKFIRRSLSNLIISDREKRRFARYVGLRGKKLESYIGSDGRKLMRDHLSALLDHALKTKDPKQRAAAFRKIERNAEDAVHLLDRINSKEHSALREKIIAFAVMREPHLIYDVPWDKRKAFVKRVLELGATHNKDLFLFLSVLPPEYRNDTKLIVPLLYKRPHYLALLAPQLARYRTKLAINAYKLGIRLGWRFPRDGKALAKIVSYRLLASIAKKRRLSLATVIYTTTDHNASYRDLSSIVGRMVKGYFTLYYEAKNENDVDAALKVSKRLGGSALLLVGGHGLEKSLELAKARSFRIGSRRYLVPNEKLTLDTGDHDISWKGSVVKGGHVVLEACLNGKGGGIDNPKNHVSHVARQLVGVYVHGQTASGNTYARFNRLGKFTGTGNYMSGSDTVVVMRRSERNNLYKQWRYNPSHNRKFPHPPFTPKSTPAAWKALLGKVAKNGRTSAMRLAAAYMRGDVGRRAWGRFMRRAYVRYARYIEDYDKPQPSDRRHYRLRLRRMGDSYAIPANIRMMMQGDGKGSRDIAIKELIKLGRRAMPALTAMLRSSDRIACLNAMYVIKAIQKKDPGAITPIVAALIDLRNDVSQHYTGRANGNWNARYRVIKRLRDVPHPSVNAIIASRLLDSDSDVRTEAAKVLLYRNADPRLLLDALQSDSHEIIYNALKVLIGLKSDAARLFQIKLLSPSFNIGGYARLEIADFLAKKGEKRARKPLERMLSEDNAYVQMKAAEALGMLRDKKAIPALKAHLKDKKCRAKADILVALGRLKVRAVIPRIVSILRTPNHEESTRKTAIEVLGELGGDHAIAALVPIAVSDDKWGQASTKALSRMRRANVAALMIQRFRYLDYRYRYKQILSEWRDDETFYSLIAASGDPDLWTREGVIEALGNHRRKEAVPTLLKALRDKHYKVRLQAVIALGKLPGKKYADVFKRVMRNDDNPKVRKTAVEQLAAYNDKAHVPAFIRAVKDHHDVRTAAVKALAAHRDPRALKPLLWALGKNGYDNYDAKAEAALALGILGDRRAIDPLKKVIDDPSRSDVDVNAIKALAMFRDVGLTQLFVKNLISGWCESVKVAAAHALGDLGHQAAIPVLAFLAGRSDYTNEKVRRAAVDALIKIGSAWADCELINTVKKLDSPGQYMLEKIFKTRRALYASVAKAVLESKLTGLQEHVVVKLRTMKMAEAFPILLKALKASYWLVRKDAVETLGKRGDRKAIPHLEKMLKDEAESVRDAAKGALEQLRRNKPKVVAQLSGAQ